MRFFKYLMRLSFRRRSRWLLGFLVVLGGVFALGYWLGGSSTYSPAEIPDITAEEKGWQSQGQLFYDGLYVIGSDLEPGIYRTTGRDTSVYGCRWQRLSGFKAETDNIIVDYRDNQGRPTIVEIAASDRGFKTEGCGKWYRSDVKITDERQTFGDGAFLVGLDIEPGLYRSEAPWGCYWERLSGLSRHAYRGRLYGLDSELIAASRNTVVEIAAEDVAFISHKCLRWTLQTGSPEESSLTPDNSINP